MIKIYPSQRLRLDHRLIARNLCQLNYQYVPLYDTSHSNINKATTAAQIGATS